MRRIALVATLLFAARAASAQLPAMPSYENGRRSVSGHLGSARPTGTNRFDQAASKGPALDLRFLYYPVSWLAVGPEASYESFGSGSSAAGLAVLGRVNLLEDSSWTPYVLGGAGFHSFSLSGTSAAGASSCAPFKPPCKASMKATSNGLLIRAGGGVEVFIFRSFSASIEASLHRFHLSDKQFSGNVETLTVLFGLHLWLGS